MAATNFHSSWIILVLSLTTYSILCKNQQIASRNDQEYISAGWINKVRLLLVGRVSFVAETRHSRSAILNPYDVHPGLLKLLCKLLLLGGDVMLNPGPNWKFPCGKCEKPVKSNQKGIMCDFCDRWYHPRCCSVSDTMFVELANSSCIWICNDCGVANYSSSLFDSQDPVSCENSFSQLTDISTYTTLSCTGSCSESSRPISESLPHTSTPTKSKQNSYKLKCMEINCNSIVSTERAAIFKANVELHKPDVIFGCESKLSPDIPTNASFPRDYTIYRKERQIEGGGGVFLAVKSDIVSVDHHELSADPNDELIWASIKLTRAKELHLCSFYKSPSAPASRIDTLADNTSQLFQKAKNNCPHLVIAGDFNLGDIDWSEDPPTTTNPQTAVASETLLNFIDDYDFIQSVTEPTRPASGNILDLVISSAPSLVTSVQTHPGMSDHNVVTFYINARPTRTPKPPHKVYLYNRMDLDGLKNEANNINNEFFSSDPNSRTINENWDLFKVKLQAAIDTFIPHKMTKSKLNLPWLTRSIKRQMRKRDKLHSLANHSSKDSIKAAYRKQRNKVVTLLRSAHTNYLCNEIGESLSSNSKRFWSYIKQCRSENNEIPTLRRGGELYITNKDKAEVLNNQFKSVFIEDDGIAPDVGLSPYLCISSLTFDVEGVRKQLTNLNSSKACGPDNLSPHILKALADELSQMLTYIFQQSYDTGNLPEDWLKARVTPVYKKEEKTNPANYRPISLTCICCKIMEHIVLSHINKHLSANDILCKNQHGFRAKLSCETQLVLAIHEWASILNNKGQVDVILLDFSKAFDKVSHLKLLNKLSHYGIQGLTLGWINGFLSNRSQVVTVNGQHSSSCRVLSGVPQGSVLGPTLFLLYINDIVEGLNSNIKLFADDTIIYRQITTAEDHDILQSDLVKLVNWSTRWQMEFNYTKCYYMQITNKRNPSSLPYCMYGNTLKCVSSQDYLGVTQTSDLKWKKHCEKVACKANKTLGLIRRTLKACNCQVKERAYQALVRPKLEYASSAWNPYTDRDVDQIEKVQRRAARFVCNNYRRTTSSQDLVNELGWDSLENRRLLHQVSMFYKIRNGLVNISFPSCVKKSPRSCKPYAYLQPFVNVLAFSYSPFVRSIRIWNNLSERTVLASNLHIFQTHALHDIRTMSPPAHLKRL